MLFSNVTLQLLPVCACVAHLGKERCFEPTQCMARIECILPQLAWIDACLLWQRDGTEHIDIVSSWRKSSHVWLGRALAGQVLAQFAITARDETDMNVLTMELARIVHEAIEPDGVRAWLRK